MPAWKSFEAVEVSRDSLDGVEACGQAFSVTARALAVGGLVVAAFGANACSAASAVRVPRPGSSGLLVPNHVFVRDPTWSEQSVGVPASALTSEASLYSLNDGRVCFDVIVRSWSGADGHWRVRLAINGRDVEASGWMPFACKPKDSCLPHDSTVHMIVSDTDPLVSARGSRLCFKNTGVPAYRVRRVTLSATQGGTSLAFRWRFEPKSSTRVVGAD